MAATNLSLLLLLSLLAAAAMADYSAPPTASPPPSTLAPAAPPKDKVRVMVEGMVYCQSCAAAGSWSLSGAQPLPGAKVTVTCRDAKNRVVAWQSPAADEKGYFLAAFDVAGAGDYYMGDPRKACFVRLLASPDTKCNGLTDINYGIAGAPVRDEGKRFPGEEYDTAVYASGPLAFKPASCVPMHHY